MNYTQDPYGAAMGRMMVTKGLGRCRWSYDGVEGSVVVEGPKMVYHAKFL